MTAPLRLLLTGVSIMALIFMMHKIRRSQVQIEDAIFWVVLSLVLIGISIRPGLIYHLCNWLGIVSPSNFVFLIIIFVLLIKVFHMSIRASILESRVKELIQEQALDRYEEQLESEHEKD